MYFYSLFTFANFLPAFIIFFNFAFNDVENSRGYHRCMCSPKFDLTTKELIGVRITSNNKVVNKAIIHQKRYMPSIRDLTFALSDMKVFSKVDIKDTFNQCLIKPECRHLTAYSTQWGTYQYCRLNMGLAIASELFQQVMTENLKHIPNQRLATGGIIVFGRVIEECKLYTEMMLKTLADPRVNASFSKRK